jgi:hypothetical protein
MVADIPFTGEKKADKYAMADYVTYRVTYIKEMNLGQNCLSQKML